MATMPPPAAPTDPLRPSEPGGLRTSTRVLGRYELQRELGRGAMGVVWLAIDRTLQRQIALKVLPDILRQDRAALVDLRDETRRNLEITHPHIVRIYNFEEDDELAGITMEFVDGETLAAKKAARPERVFEALELVPWMRQLCEALHYAHTDPRVVHRDLKPANLMVNARGQLKITDFGIARSISDSVSRATNAGPTSGTLVYMSPQQLMGSASASDDIYSIGATLYELITGKPPFHTGNISAQILQATPPLMSERRAQLGRNGGPIPVAFEELVAACLAKDPARRPPTPLAVLECLDRGTNAGTARHFPAPPLTGETGTHRAEPQPPPTTTTPPALPSIPASSELPMALVPIARSGSRWWWLVAVLIAAGMLALAGRLYVMTRGQKGDEAPAPPASTARVPEPGGVMVNTVPSGARIFLDGRAVGTSPLIIEEVAPGAHQLRCEAVDYEPLDLRVWVNAGETVDRGPVPLIAMKRPDPAPMIVPPAPVAQPPAAPVSLPVPLPGLSAEAVRQVIREYLAATARADLNGVLACYSSGVDFFDEGTLTKAQLRASLTTFRNQWPVLDVVGLSDIEVNDTGDPEIKTARYSYRFIARNGRKASSGIAHDTATVKRFADRALIIRTRQTVANREKNFK